MDDARVGAAFRAVRIRRGWRQVDVALRASVSRSQISMLERGHVGSVAVDSLRQVAAALDMRIDLVARWRGGELDRLLNARHAALSDAVAAWLISLGWEVAPEVSFAIYGERGWIDLLAWHAPTRTLLVIEIKTEIVDVQEMIGIVDRKTRLASVIARDRGWVAAKLARMVIIGEGATNRRRVLAHASLLGSAFRADTRACRAWLRRPAESLSGLMFFSDATGGSANAKFSSQKRVRRPSKVVTSGS